MVNPTLLCLCAVSKTVQVLNSVCIIRSTLGNAIGVQKSLKEKLQQRKEHKSPLVKVKITAESMCALNSMHIVVIAFAVSCSICCKSMF